MSAPIRNLSRRELRAREQGRLIVTRSDVPLTRAEREKREIATYWQMRFDERTAKAQIVVARWTKIRELRTEALRRLVLLRNSLSVATVKTGENIRRVVEVDAERAEAAVEAAESFILHEGADRWIGEYDTWAPREELRLLQARL